MTIGNYSIIYADPPWQYQRSKVQGAAENHYPTMGIDELCALPSPSAYKLQKGIPVSTRGYDDPMWGARMIHSILTNPTYTGDLAQGRSRVKSYKVHEVESVPREEWVEVAGTHEAIIDYETFVSPSSKLFREIWDKTGL